MTENKAATAATPTKPRPLPTDLTGWVAQHRSARTGGRVKGDKLKGDPQAPVWYGEPHISPDNPLDIKIGDVPLFKVATDTENRCGVYVRGDVYDCSNGVPKVDIVPAAHDEDDDDE